MPRKKLVKTCESPYHITTRSNNKEIFHVPLDRLWPAALSFLGDGIKRFNVRVYSFVLMSNHYHLLLSTPDENIDKFMHFFNKSLSHYIAKHSGRINRIFGAPYHWSVIKNEHYFINVYRYIYQNPVRANIVSRCEDYLYTTLNQKMKKSFADLELYVAPYSDFCDYDLDSLSWLNNQFDDIDSDIIRRGLKSGLYVETLTRKQQFRCGKSYQINAMFSKKVPGTGRPSTF